MGADGFDYAIIDETGASDSAHVAITVTANGAPDAVDDTYARGDDLVLEVLTNDTDPEGEFFKITSVTQPAHGAATISGDENTVTYTQTSNFSATDSFTYTITDSGGGTDTATVTLQACPALAPALDGGGIVTSERWVACSALRANGVVGPTTTVLPPQGGQSALLTSGDIALAPGPNDSSGATASNGTELRGARDVSILRLDLMIPAGANCLSFDFAFQSEEYPEFVNSPYNDAFLAELDASTWSVANSVITAPNNFAFDSAGGIVSINGSFFEPDRVVTDTGSQYDGSTPLLSVRTPVTPGAHALYLSIFDAGDTALDSAAFVDGLVAGTAGPGGCSAGANEPPNAVNDGFESPEDTVTAPFNVLANDSDPDDGQTLTVTTLSPSAQHGTVTCTAAGMCTYTPAPNYHGPDSFTYGISDGHGGTDTATVLITVMPVNDEPNAVDDVLTTAHGHRRARSTCSPTTPTSTGDSLAVPAVPRQPRHRQLRWRARAPTRPTRATPGRTRSPTSSPTATAGADRRPSRSRSPPSGEPAAGRRRRDAHGRRGHAGQRQRARRRHRPRRRHAYRHLGSTRPPRTAASAARGPASAPTRRTRTTTAPTRSTTRSPTATAARTRARSRSRSRR